MVHAMSLNLPALLTVLTVQYLPQLVCCVCAIPSAVLQWCLSGCRNNRHPFRWAWCLR